MRQEVRSVFGCKSSFRQLRSLASAGRKFLHHDKDKKAPHSEGILTCLNWVFVRVFKEKFSCLTIERGKARDTGGPSIFTSTKLLWFFIRVAGFRTFSCTYEPEFSIKGKVNNTVMVLLSLL